MPPPAKLGHASFNLGARSRDSERAESPTLRVLVAGNFSGRAARNDGEAVGSERARPIDVDRLDTVLSGLGASLTLPPLTPGGRAVELTPRGVDDLHPDRLLQSIPELSELVRLKNALPTDPSAAARLTELLGAATSASADASDAEPPSGVRESKLETGEQMVSRLLGGASGRDPSGERDAAPPAIAGFDVQRLVKSLIGGLADAPAPPPDTTALASAAEHAVGERLRALLRDERFRALESAWRAVDRLVRHCPDEEQVRYFLADVSPLRLARDAEGLERLLDGGYSALLLDHSYEPDAAELQGLATVLAACSARGVSVIAGATAALAGCSGFDRAPNPDLWQHDWPEAVENAWEGIVRARAAGAELALALPRFLLRQPYGSAGETLEALRFEEILDQRDHEAFAWGNGAYLFTQALAELRASSGERAHADGSVDLRELPVVHLEADDGVEIKPCAEAWLSDRALGKLLTAGFSVLHGLRDSDRVRVHL